MPKQEETWACPLCTMLNDVKVYVCQICGARKQTSSRRATFNDQILAQQMHTELLTNNEILPERKRKKVRTSLPLSQTGSSKSDDLNVSRQNSSNPQLSDSGNREKDLLDSVNAEQEPLEDSKDDKILTIEERGNPDNLITAGDFKFYMPKKPNGIDKMKQEQVSVRFKGVTIEFTKYEEESEEEEEEEEEEAKPEAKPENETKPETTVDSVAKTPQITEPKPEPTPVSKQPSPTKTLSDSENLEKQELPPTQEKSPKKPLEPLSKRLEKSLPNYNRPKNENSNSSTKSTKRDKESDKEPNPTPPAKQARQLLQNKFKNLQKRGTPKKSDKNSEESESSDSDILEPRLTRNLERQKSEKLKHDKISTRKSRRLSVEEEGWSGTGKNSSKRRR